MPHRITILAHGSRDGSRGDVQPRVVLGWNLRQVGHRVRLAATIRDTIENNKLGRQVQTVGQSIQSEDGLGVTVALV